MKMTRIQFEVSEDKAKELTTLMKETNVLTKRELFNNALTLLEWAVKEVGDNRIVGSISSDGESYKELAMPILSSARTEKKRAEETLASG